MPHNEQRRSDGTHFPQSVLITVGRIDGMSGSELVTRELAEYFATRGSKVHIVTHVVGVAVEDELRVSGDVRILLASDEDLNDRLVDASVDFVWIQHLLIPELVFNLEANIPIVFNHMSRRVPIERPLLPSLEEALATVVVFNSPTVRDALTEPGILDRVEASRVQVFANPAPDGFALLDRSARSGKPRMVVVSNHIPGEILEALRFVEDSFEIELIGMERELGAEPRRVDPGLLTGADVVVSIGKTVQYALAAEIAVFCYDHFGGPGWLTEENFQKAKYTNFAGVGFSKKTAQQISQELLQGFPSASDAAPRLREAFGRELLLSARMEDLITYVYTNPRSLKRVPNSDRRLHDGIEQTAAKWFKAMSSAERFRRAAYEAQVEANAVRAERDVAVAENRMLREDSTTADRAAGLEMEVVSPEQRVNNVAEVVTPAPVWRVRRHPLITELSSRVLRAATLSRAESGTVYWDSPNPRRSFVRGAVYDSGLKLVPESQRLGGMNSDMVLTVNPPILSRQEKVAAESMQLAGLWVYAGTWMHGFGHFLLETLPTLWWLIGEDRGVDGVVAHRFNSRRTFDWQFELVKLLTDRQVLVVDEDPVRVNELVVPDRAYHYQVAISPEAARVWDFVSSRAVDGLGDTLAPPGRVYLSRSHFEAQRGAEGISTGREFANADEIDAVFAEHGFEIVFPETLSVIEQIRVARSASILAGQAGSALHLSVFCQPGARVIELGDSRTKNQMVGAQQAISAAKQQMAAHIPYIADADGNIDTGHLRAALSELLS